MFSLTGLFLLQVRLGPPEVFQGRTFGDCWCKNFSRLPRYPPIVSEHWRKSAFIVRWYCYIGYWSRCSSYSSDGNTVQFDAVFWSSLPARILRHVRGRGNHRTGWSQTNGRLSDDSFRLCRQTPRTLQWQSWREWNLRWWQTRKSSCKCSYTIICR